MTFSEKNLVLDSEKSIPFREKDWCYWIQPQKPTHLRMIHVDILFWFVRVAIMKLCIFISRDKARYRSRSRSHEGRRGTARSRSQSYDRYDKYYSSSDKLSSKSRSKHDDRIRSKDRRWDCDSIHICYFCIFRGPSEEWASLRTYVLFTNFIFIYKNWYTLLILRGKYTFKHWCRSRLNGELQLRSVIWKLDRAQCQ